MLEQKETDLALDRAASSRRLHDRVMAQLAEGSTVTENFSRIADAISETISFDGIAGWLDGQFTCRGITPSREEFMALVPFLNTTTSGQIFATDCLSRRFPKAADYADRVSGLLALPVSRTPRDFIVLFRQELAKSVTWAGNPEKPVEAGPNGVRLTPRKSFEAWKEVVRNHSSPWSKSELETAESLRVTLLEVVLRMTDEAMRQREKAEQHQELLIAELNHRVRNILNLIQGLVGQSKLGVEDAAEMADIVGGRIAALSRAHDLITKENWSPASFTQLVLAEAEGYLMKDRERVTLEGSDAMLRPEAFSAVALVIHELTTNSAKYGALSNENGEVTVTTKRFDDGAFGFSWTEQGGPPVSAPGRRGFGSTIIERSIPHELKGEADISFEVSGLKAKFLLPSVHIEGFQDFHKEEKSVPDLSDLKPIDDGCMLLVEDSMIIAMDAEIMIRKAGARQVEVASSVDEALGLIEKVEFDAAVLDINLGRETSEQVAEKLLELNVPFVFATGYGALPALVEKFPGARVIQKPYQDSLFIEAVQSMFQHANEG